MPVRPRPLQVPANHFVLGDASPFVFELGHFSDWSRLVWACYMGPATANFTGVGQGGAIASIFDIALTMATTDFAVHTGGTEGAYCVTASLQAAYKAPVTPLPGVFRLDITLVKIDGRRVTAAGELRAGGDGSGPPMATGEAVGVNINAPRKARL